MQLPIFVSLANRYEMPEMREKVIVIVQETEKHCCYSNRTECRRRSPAAFAGVTGFGIMGGIVCPCRTLKKVPFDAGPISRFWLIRCCPLARLGLHRISVRRIKSIRSLTRLWPIGSADGSCILDSPPLNHATSWKTVLPCKRIFLDIFRQDYLNLPT